MILKEKKRNRQLIEEYNQKEIGGAVNIDAYLNADFKIMWVMKEVNDRGVYNQHRAFQELVNEVMTIKTHKTSKVKEWAPTMGPIINYTHQINTGLKPYNKIKRYNQDYKTVKTLEQIVFVNVNNESGGSVANNNVLENAFKNSKERLKKQIEVYQSDVIIYGNTMRFVKNEFNLNELKTDKAFKYQVKDNIIHIDAYHTNQRKIKYHAYGNTLIDIIKTYYK